MSISCDPFWSTVSDFSLNTDCRISVVAIAAIYMMAGLLGFVGLYLDLQRARTFWSSYVPPAAARGRKRKQKAANRCPRLKFVASQYMLHPKRITMATSVLRGTLCVVICAWKLVAVFSNDALPPFGVDAAHSVLHCAFLTTTIAAAVHAYWVLLRTMFQNAEPDDLHVVKAAKQTKIALISTSALSVASLLFATIVAIAFDPPEAPLVSIMCTVWLIGAACTLHGTALLEMIIDYSSATLNNAGAPVAKKESA